MSQERQSKSWPGKFRNAIRGISIGIRGDQTNSFRVHLPVAIVVVLSGIVLQLDVDEMSILLICIALVIGGELFNGSLERLSKAVTDQYDEHLRDALDIASGAVLWISCVSAVVGGLVLGNALLKTLS